MVNGNPAVPKDSNCHKCSQTLKPGQLQKCFPEEVLLYIRLTMKNLIGREHSINSQ